jgi:hypothetical protein
MPPGQRSPHHLVPKMFKGRETVDLHPICHRKIHSLWSERELKNRFHSIERILEAPEIRTFVAWVRGKPAEFYERTEDARRKRRRR